ncbi:hypothetical protein KL866_01350 [Alteromonas sp. ALT199]|uniref:hypothetical protein n=1 Tax=unclassified Alteromonas TaxID=2614992 RepID=UPI00044EECDC|nr:hypothetical protein [Alteromonas sp. ALT199]MBT3133783.1 hypothetical protein [Alteromonas sp. ALT199]
MSKFRPYHPKLHRAVKRYSAIQYVIVLGIMLFLSFNMHSLPMHHQLIAVITVVVMCIQNGFILLRARVALAVEGPRLLIFPLLWVAAGMGIAALVYSVFSFAALMVLVNAVRHKNHRPPLHLANEPENLA